MKHPWRSIAQAARRWSTVEADPDEHRALIRKIGHWWLLGLTTSLLAVADNASAGGLVSISTIAGLVWCVAIAIVFVSVRRARPGRWLLGMILLQSVPASVTIATAHVPTVSTIYMLSVASSALLLPFRAALLMALAQAAFGISLVSMFLGSYIYAVVNLTSAWALLVPTSLPFGFGVAVRATIMARYQAEVMAQRQAMLNRALEDAMAAGQALVTARERTRIARELHDSLGHSLTSIHIQLEAAARHLDAGADADTRRVVSEARESAELGLAQLRDCVAVLRERRGDDKLASAMRTLVERFPAPATESRFTVHGRERVLEASRDFALFRALQEALTNIAKHARASSFHVELTYLDHHARLQICDDGIGGADVTMGRGLAGIRERLEACGGSLSVDSAHPRGSRLCAEVPIA